MTLGNATSEPSVRLALTAHQWAQRFSRRHSDPAKAKRVYLNTLAVYAVQMYLERLGMEVDLAASQSWNPVQQALIDVADLMVPRWGTLECRPVPPDAKVLTVPPEVWSDRRGYVAVQIDESLRQAELLGWVPTVETEVVSLATLTSLDELTAQLLHAAASVEGEPERTHLGQWLQSLAEAGWQAADGLLQLFSGQLQAEFEFRGDRPEAGELQNQSAAITRCKSLSLSTSQGAATVNLIVGLLPQSPTEMEIWVQIAPLDSDDQLPARLRLTVLDEQGEDVMSAQARATEAMQLRFSGQIGEQFSVRVALDEESVSEHFVI